MKYIAIAVLSMCLWGCAMYKIYYAYNVSAKNTGETLLHDIVITSDQGFWHATGYLNSGAVKTLAGLKSVPPNGIYTILVKGINDQERRSVINLHDKIRKSFRGEILFLVDENFQATVQLE